MRTSYSNIECFRNCPLKYKYQNIDKIKAPKNIDALFGSSIHASLKFMFQRGPLYPTLDQIVDFFRTIWEQKKLPMEAGSVDSSAETVYYKEGISLLEKFYKSNPPWNYNVVDMESRFEFEIDDQKTGEKHTISGIMDRIDKNADGSFEIIDYKTKRKMPGQYEIDGDLQMSIYQLGLLKK
ncbi:MAG: PD-(D/E)XK nuclease family protein, partial [Patescibacteria group bacterium]